MEPLCLDKFSFNFPENYNLTEEEAFCIIMEKCKKALSRFAANGTETTERLEKELEVIQFNNLSRRFLFIQEFLSGRKNKFLAFGALNNSFVAYLLAITKINPLDFDLPFERFIRIGRKKPVPSFGFFTCLAKRDMIESNQKNMADDDMGDIYIQSIKGMRLIKRFADLKDFTKNQNLFNFIKENIEDLNYFLRYPLSPIILSNFPLRNFKDLVFITASSLNPWILWNYKAPNKLKETQGCLSYQEQFIQLIQSVANFSAEEAEEFRRNICRKKNTPLKELYLSYTKDPFLWEQLEASIPQCVCKGAVISDAFLLCNIALTQMFQ